MLELEKQKNQKATGDDDDDDDEDFLDDEPKAEAVQEVAEKTKIWFNLIKSHNI